MDNAVRRKLYLHILHAVASYTRRFILTAYIAATIMLHVVFRHKGNNLLSVCAQTVHDSRSHTHIYNNERKHRHK